MLKIAFHPIYKYQLPPGHRFPMEKYELLPQQLLQEGTCRADNFFEPEILSEENILAVHTKEYFDDLLNLTLDKTAIRKIGFPLSETLVKRGRIISQGTIDCCEYALKYGIAMNIAGGTHHAYSDHGEGFCLFNDQAIAAKYLLNASNLHSVTIKKILIVDLDVHQGNGTAKIFENVDSVFTFSMHGAGNYPFKKEKSDLDIAVPDGAGDEVYLEILKETLPKLIKEQKNQISFFI